jgi:hypothetical protein
MRQPPAFHWAKDLERYNCKMWVDNKQADGEVVIPGHWTPARPRSWSCGFDLKQRFKMAWWVFTGKCDALYWEDQ